MNTTNADVIWLHIGQGVNTVRLDNVGFINGGHGIQFDSNPRITLDHESRNSHYDGGIRT
jgi:hypothetical protein